MAIDILLISIQKEDSSFSQDRYNRREVLTRERERERERETGTKA